MDDQRKETGGKGAGLGGFRPRPEPTQDQLDRTRAEMERPIYLEVKMVNGYRCDRCDHWFQVSSVVGKGWKLRYGCPECGEKSMSFERAGYCNHCGGLVPDADREEHQDICNT